MLGNIGAVLILALADLGQGRPAEPPIRITDNPHIPCLVSRGAYCVPDTGLYVMVYSSDEVLATILKIGDRVGLPGHGYAIESGRCDRHADHPVLLQRIDSYTFEGQSWRAADFRLNATCRLRVLSQPLQRGVNEFGPRMLSAIRPCRNRACRDGSLILILPEFARPRSR